MQPGTFSASFALRSAVSVFNFRWRNKYDDLCVQSTIKREEKLVNGFKKPKPDSSISSTHQEALNDCSLCAKMETEAIRKKRRERNYAATTAISVLLVFASDFSAALQAPARGRLHRTTRRSHATHGASWNRTAIVVVEAENEMKTVHSQHSSPGEAHRYGCCKYPTWVYI